MQRDWLAMEHYRLHVMEQWPESLRKEAGLAAVQATLDSMERTDPAACAKFVCAECLAKVRRAPVIRFPLVDIGAARSSIAA